MATGTQNYDPALRDVKVNSNSTVYTEYPPSEYAAQLAAIPKYSTMDSVTIYLSWYTHNIAGGNIYMMIGDTQIGSTDTVQNYTKSMTQNVTSYFNSNNASAGYPKATPRVKLSSGLFSRTVKVENFEIDWSYTLPTFKISATATTGGTVSGDIGTYDVTTTNQTKTIKATPNAGYKFVGWKDSSGTVVSTNASMSITISHNSISAHSTTVSYTAVFEPITYTVTFKDENGATLKTETVNHGSTATAPSDPVKADTAQHKYTFDGWYDANGNKWYPNTAITGDTVYTARYTAEVQRYTVKWYNEDGSELLETDESVPYGTMPTYDGATPTKAETEENTYEHIGWSIDVNSSETTDLSAVVESVSYYARFRAISKGYTVIWKNEDGTVLETDTVVPFGTQPDYNGATPEKASDVQYDYTFLGWSAKVEDPPLDDSQLPTVTGNITYTAVYTKTLKLYPIKVILFDTEYTSVVEYGSDIVLEAPEVIGYKFTKWTDGNTANPRTVRVTGEATYQAVYERIPVPIIVNEEQQVTGVYFVPASQTIVYVISGEVPAVVANGVTVDDLSFKVSNSVPDNSYPIEKLYINETRIW